MKRLKISLQILSIALLILINSNVKAASISNLEIEPQAQEKTLMLSFLTKGLGEINIQIVDQNENVLFSEKVNSGNSIQKKFILDNLSLGDYSLEVEDEFKITVQPLTVESNDISVNREFRKTHFKPQIRLTQEGKYLDFDWLMNKEGEVEFSIEDSYSNFSFENKTTVQKLVQKRFDVRQLPKGLYYVTVKNDEHTFYETIRI
ncbi:MAG: DUF3244 domain-containing protein [Saprospiraceae bacterium]|nr:DUF3244 domain-containing protein [Saprospiraceae bacterium]